jgi:hypothetical protein
MAGRSNRAEGSACPTVDRVRLLIHARTVAHDVAARAGAGSTHAAPVRRAYLPAAPAIVRVGLLVYAKTDARGLPIEARRAIPVLVALLRRARYVLGCPLHDPAANEVEVCLREERCTRSASERERHRETAAPQVSASARVWRLHVERALGVVYLVPKKALRRVTRLDVVHERILIRDLRRACPLGRANEGAINRREGRRRVDGGQRRSEPWAASAGSRGNSYRGVPVTLGPEARREIAGRTIALQDGHDLIRERNRSRGGSDAARRRGRAGSARCAGAGATCCTRASAESRACAECAAARARRGAAARARADDGARATWRRGQREAGPTAASSDGQRHKRERQPPPLT